MHPTQQVYEYLKKNKEVEDFFKINRCKDSECIYRYLIFGHSHMPIPNYEFSKYNCPECSGRKKFDYAVRDVPFLSTKILYGYHYICENNKSHQWAEKIDIDYDS